MLIDIAYHKVQYDAGLIANPSAAISQVNAKKSTFNLNKDGRGDYTPEEEEEKTRYKC